MVAPNIPASVSLHLTLRNEDGDEVEVAITGQKVTTLREGDKQIPVVARLRMEERAQLADLNNLYVYSSQGTGRVPLGQVSSIEHGMQTEKRRRRNQFRTITVSCFPKDGRLPSEVMGAVRAKLTAGSRAVCHLRARPEAGEAGAESIERRGLL